MVDVCTSPITTKFTVDGANDLERGFAWQGGKKKKQKQSETGINEAIFKME